MDIVRFICSHVNDASEKSDGMVLGISSVTKAVQWAIFSRNLSLEVADNGQ